MALEILTFKSPSAFRNWLEKNHAATEGIWLRVFKKASREQSITYGEALDQALCYGWIDGQKKAHDDHSWLQKFTPRRPKSGWSKMNTRHAERLIESEKMAPAGLKEVEAAKSDGRWKAAYDSFGNATVPIDFLKELTKDNRAKAFFETLNKTNLYSIAYRLQTAKKPETREKRKSSIDALKVFSASLYYFQASSIRFLSLSRFPGAPSRKRASEVGDKGVGQIKE
jgi:uncharacterized protein YdeI (YjbR/CyaY-like superfamily)